MGKVTEELTSLISKQVKDHGIVVWYDPEHAYGEVADKLDLPDVTLLRYTGSFFELRHRVEPFLEFVGEDGMFRTGLETPPLLLICVPLDRARAQNALIEAEAAGVVMEPGGSPWQRNTRLKVIAERVFKRFAPDRADSIASEVEAGRRTLAELDWLAEQTGELGALKLIFGSTSIADVIPKFLSSEEHDEAIVNKNALPELMGLCETELGLNLSPDQPIEQVRQQLCRSLLLAELALKIGPACGDTSGLASIPIPQGARQKEQLLEVCRQWRNRLDLKEAYAEWADRVQTEAQVVCLGLQAEVLTDAETFSCVESLLLEWAGGQILDGAVAGAIEVARRRKSAFWSLHDGEYQLLWSLLETACLLLLAAGRIESEIKAIRKGAGDIVSAYIEGIPGPGGGEPLPWCVLDRHHRHLECRYAMLELRPEGHHAQLEKIIAHTRRRYADTVGICAEEFAQALAAKDFEVEGIPGQDRIFSQHVRTCAAEEKAAYILVDSLRYEMGQDLIEGLGDQFECSIIPVLAQPPTITEVGMAALMPDAEKGMELVDVGGGKVGIHIGDALLKNRETRVQHFESKVAGRLLSLRLNDLMKPTRKQQEEIIDADILLVTSQEIDRRGEETKDEEEARRFMDEVLEKLRRGIRCLASLGVQRIIVAADHGHLFVDELAEAMKIDPPGGETVDLHPRVWIGRGGSAAPGYRRVRSSDLGLGGDLECAFPLGLACFRTRGGSRGYFHGGISPQELVVPLADITVKEMRVSGRGTSTVTITLAKPKITTRFFSVEARYVVSSLVGERTKRVKVVVRANHSEVGVAAMAAYGFEEGKKEIVLEEKRPNAITMMLTADVDMPALSVHVLDATTLVELAAIRNIPVAISI